MALLAPVSSRRASPRVAAAVKDAKMGRAGEDSRLTDPLRKGASVGAAYSASLLAETL